jgi:hypothetical protein
MNMLLNPERLLKYETKKVKPKFKGYTKATAVAIKKRNNDIHEED